MSDEERQENNCVFIIFLGFANRGTSNHQQQPAITSGHQSSLAVTSDHQDSVASMVSVSRLPVGLLFVLLSVAAVRSCQLGVRGVGRRAQDGAAQLQMVPADPACQCGRTRLHMLFCREGVPCGRQERGAADRPHWRAVRPTDRLTSDQTVAVYYSGWYSVRSDHCFHGSSLWVDGINVTSWNVDMSVVAVQSATGARCLSVSVPSQSDPSASPSVMVPQLQLCLERSLWRSCREVAFPQLSAEQLCGPEAEGLRPGGQYTITVSPYVTALCGDRLPGCPYRSEVYRVPQAPAPGVAESELDRVPQAPAPGVAESELDRVPQAPAPGVAESELDRVPQATAPGVAESELDRVPQAPAPGVAESEVYRVPQATAPGVAEMEHMPAATTDTVTVVAVSRGVAAAAVVIVAKIVCIRMRLALCYRRKVPEQDSWDSLLYPIRHETELPLTTDLSNVEGNSDKN